MTTERPRVARHVSALPPSGIRRFFDLVEAMPEAISLGIGEPDFVTPERIRQAGIKSLEEGHTHYTPNRGIRPLLDEIAVYLKRRFGLEYDPDKEIVITVGGSEAIDVALRCLLEPGDAVLIPEPCFVAYSPCTILAGGRPVPVTSNAEHNFQVQVEQLEESYDPGVRALLLSYPSNPTGAIMPREGMERIMQFAEQRNLTVISDEVYAELTYGGEHASAASVPGGRERTILVGGFSKAWAMTGWRLGFAAGPPDIIAAMVKVHSYAIMCSPTTAQEAAIEALRCCDDDVRKMREEYDERRQFIVRRLNEIGLTCFEPKGAFYAFPSIASTGLSSEEFAQRLLEEEKVAVVPGPAFGACGEGFVRCSYATALPKIEEAMKRIEAFVKRICK